MQQRQDAFRKSTRNAEEFAMAYCEVAGMSNMAKLQQLMQVNTGCALWKHCAQRYEEV